MISDILEGLLPIQGFGSVGGFAFDRGASSDYPTAGTEGTINRAQRDGKKKGFVRVAVHQIGSDLVAFFSQGIVQIIRVIRLKL